MECKLVSKLTIEEKGKTDQGDSACTTHTHKREFRCGIVRKKTWLEDALNWKLDGGWVAKKR